MYQILKKIIPRLEHATVAEKMEGLKNGKILISTLKTNDETFMKN